MRSVPAVTLPIYGTFFQLRISGKYRNVIPGNYSSLLHGKRLETYRGKAWYRTHFASKGKNIRLFFGGVSHTGIVYVDGKKAGKRNG